MLEEQTLAKAAPCTPSHPSVAGRPSAIRAASPWEEQTCHMESRSFGEMGRSVSRILQILYKTARWGDRLSGTGGSAT